MFAMLCALSCLHLAGTVMIPDPYQIFSESSTIYKLVASDLTVILTDDSPVVAMDYHYK